MTQLETAVKNIASLNRPWYDVSFGGGEPTIHPHIFELITMFQETLKERLNSIRIITNGSRNEELYKKIADIAKSIPLQMIISIHTDHVDMAHILDVLKALSQNVELNFSLMFNPAKRDMVHSIYETMFECRKNFRFTMNVVTLREGDIVDPRYTQEDFAWQKKAVAQFNALEKAVESNFPAPKKKKLFRTFYEVADVDKKTGNVVMNIAESQNRTVDLANGLLQFKDMFCVAHAALLYVQEDGLCRGMVCNADPIICNIFEEGSLKAVRDKLIHAVKYPLQNCGCSDNDRIPKFAFSQEALRFVEVVKAKQNALFDEVR